MPILSLYMGCCHDHSISAQGFRTYSQCPWYWEHLVHCNPGYKGIFTIMCVYGVSVSGKYMLAFERVEDS